MVKKSIIAIALMCMLATVSYGQDVWGVTGQVKVDGLWPATITIDYTPIEICRIPIWIKIGMFIEIENCGSKKIVLSQVNCPQFQSFPCYAGCVSIKVRANFEAQLSLKLYKTSDIISGFGFNQNWKAYFTNDGGATKPTTWIVTGDGEWNNVDICVEAWDANIYGPNITPNTQQKVGDVAILAVPTAIPDYCDYCPSENYQ